MVACSLVGPQIVVKDLHTCKDRRVGLLEMVKALEQERKARKLESIPETVRAVLGEYFKRRTEP